MGAEGAAGRHVEYRRRVKVESVGKSNVFISIKERLEGSFKRVEQSSARKC